MSPSGVTAQQIIDGAAGEDVRINAVIALLGRQGGGTLQLNGVFNTGGVIINVENDVHIVAGPGGASIVLAKDSSLDPVYDWAVIMGRTGGTVMQQPSILNDGTLQILFNENGVIGPNDPIYLVADSTGTLPTGTTSAHPYYVVNRQNQFISGTWFVTTQLSLTAGGPPIAASDAGVGPLYLFYSWFGPPNVNTGTSTITFPAVGQRMPTDRPIFFRTTSNVDAHLPAGLLGRANIFYAVNETANMDGTYSYQFAQSQGGLPVSITGTGTAGEVFSAIPATTGQSWNGIGIDATAATAANAAIGTIQVQSCCYGCCITNCPSIATLASYAISFRAPNGFVLNNRIVNNKGGITAPGSITSYNLFAQNEFITGNNLAHDIRFFANSLGNVAVNNKLTAMGIQDQGTNNVTTPNFS